MQTIIALWRLTISAGAVQALAEYARHVEPLIGPGMPQAKRKVDLLEQKNQMALNDRLIDFLSDGRYSCLKARP
ncbi:MAG TPA: hypothetical protein VFN66_08260 [Burkholderiales bacterium]|nr:hypothetical protein [Burkholderiales bacterium]